MIIYLCMKYESKFTNVFKRYRTETIFRTDIKGHNSDNNQWFLSVIELDLYFMIIYLCMKYESNTPLFSKDIARKPFFVHTGRDVRTYVCTDVRTRVMLYAPPPIINGGGIKKVSRHKHLLQILLGIESSIL